MCVCVCEGEGIGWFLIRMFSVPDFSFFAVVLICSGSKRKKEFWVSVKRRVANQRVFGLDTHIRHRTRARVGCGVRCDYIVGKHINTSIQANQVMAGVNIN